MSPDFDHRLRAMAGVVVQLGLNLQPGQPLLITDPYELQGVHPDALPLAEAIRAAAGTPTTIIPADPARLRALVGGDDRRALDHLLSQHIAQLHRHLANGGAFLFLTGGASQLFQSLHAVQAAEFDQLKWRHLGPLIQQLIRGATQWTLVPAPTSAWAEAVYPDLPAGQRLDALWRVVFAALRIQGSNAGGSSPPGSDSSEPSVVAQAGADTKASLTSEAIIAWRTHLDALTLRCAGLNEARHRQVHYVGPGTDLTLELSRNHVWCTARLVAKSGVPFVVNLPTEEIFTAPHKDSAHGRVRVARPIVHAGHVVSGITLEFAGGKVVAAQAETGQDLLRQLLATDGGAKHLGEVAIVPQRNALSLSGRFFQHILLDENATNHIALGEAYRFCSRAWLPVSLNSSQIHVDLPLDARVELS